MNWTVANLVNDVSLGERFGYKNANLNYDNFHIEPTSVFNVSYLGEFNISYSVNDWSSLYYEFGAARGDLKFEIKGMGASSNFIRAPFLVETIILSVFSILIVIAIMYPALALIEPKFSQYFGPGTTGLVSYFEQNGLLVFGTQFLALLIVTMGSTALAMRKHLKV